MAWSNKKKSGSSGKRYSKQGRSSGSRSYPRGGRSEALEQNTPVMAVTDVVKVVRETLRPLMRSVAPSPQEPATGPLPGELVESLRKLLTVYPAGMIVRALGEANGGA